MKARAILAGLGALGLAVIAPAKEVDVSKLPPASNQQNVNFEKDVKPLFDKSCVKCHGAEKPKAKLRLDSLSAVLKGSQNGKVVESGNSAKSVLIQNVAYLGDEDEWMPPPDNKQKIKPLTKEEIGLLRAWIDQGAK